MSTVTAEVLSLYRLLDPACLADPYPLFRRLRERAPVLWDPYLHAWVVTGYDECAAVLSRFSAARAPSPEQLEQLGLAQLSPLAAVMTRQMLFLDAPAHTRLRSLASQAFTPGSMGKLREGIQKTLDQLLDEAENGGPVDVIAEIAEPLPAIVTAQLLGVPVADHRKLKQWSAVFAEVLGNFQHNPERAVVVLQSLEEMSNYFRAAIREGGDRDGLVRDLMQARAGGDRLTEDEVIANVIVTMVGGMETTTNLIGNGLLTLLRYPLELARLRAAPGMLPAAIEELLRFEPPSQHTARIAHKATLLGGGNIAKGAAVIAVMAAANRDPRRFPDPDTLVLDRLENKHLSFGGGKHFCFGAPLARLEAQITFRTLLDRYSSMDLAADSLVWRDNLGLRGLTSLPVEFGR